MDHVIFVKNEKRKKVQRTKKKYDTFIITFPMTHFIAFSFSLNRMKNEGKLFFISCEKKVSI